MIERDDRMFADWLQEGPQRGPAELPERVFVQTRTMRQRAAWTFVAHWTGSAWPGQRVIAPALLAVPLLLLALAAVLLVGSTRPRVAPLTGPAGNGSLAWDTGLGGQVFVAGPDGKGAHAIQGAWAISRSPSFSRDGTKLVFWSRPNQDRATPLDLFSANADGSDVRRINGDMRLEVNVYTVPDWSPDGRHVVFSSLDGDVSRLYMATVDGSEPPRAITGIDASRTGPAWSPDGRWIAFYQLTPGPQGVSSFSIVSPDTREQRDLYSQPNRPDSSGYLGPAWAPDSSAIVYSRPGDETKPDEIMWHAYLEARPLDGVEHRLYDEPSGSMSWPDWSPDGAWIAVGIGDADARHAIIMRPDGSGKVQLAPGPPQGSDECGIRWAPDAKSVVSQCDGFARFYLDDLQHPESLQVPSAATGWAWQRGPLP